MININFCFWACIAFSIYRAVDVMVEGESYRLAVQEIALLKKAEVSE